MTVTYAIMMFFGYYYLGVSAPAPITSALSGGIKLRIVNGVLLLHVIIACMYCSPALSCASFAMRMVGVRINASRERLPFLALNPNSTHPIRIPSTNAEDAIEVNVLTRAMVNIIAPEDTYSVNWSSRVRWFWISFAFIAFAFTASNGVPFFNDIMGFLAAALSISLTYIFVSLEGSERANSSSQRVRNSQRHLMHAPVAALFPVRVGQPALLALKLAELAPWERMLCNFVVPTSIIVAIVGTVCVIIDTVERFKTSAPFSCKV